MRTGARIAGTPGVPGRKGIAMARFGAVITAMVTPFHDDYTLDLDGAQALASHLLDNGSDGLVVTGSTGDAPADFQTASRISADAPAGFEVYSGDDWATFPFVCLGGVGVVSVAAHLVGDRMNEMIRLCKLGDVSAAWKIHSSLLPLYKALF